MHAGEKGELNSNAKTFIVMFKKINIRFTSLALLIGIQINNKDDLRISKVFSLMLKFNI